MTKISSHAEASTTAYIAELSEKRVTIVVDGKEYQLRQGDNFVLNLTADCSGSS